MALAALDGTEHHSLEIQSQPEINWLEPGHGSADSVPSRTVSARSLGPNRPNRAVAVAKPLAKRPGQVDLPEGSRGAVRPARGVAAGAVGGAGWFVWSVSVVWRDGFVDKSA